MLPRTVPPVLGTVVACAVFLAPPAAGDEAPANGERAARVERRGEPDAAGRSPRPDWGLGPLDVHDEHVLALTRLVVGPGTTRVVERGHAMIALRGDLAQTIFVNEVRDQVLDAETVHGALNVRAGLAPRLEGMLEVPLVWRWEGFLDHAVRQVEVAAGDSRGEREERPDNAYRVSGFTDGRDRFEGARGIGLGKIQLGLKYRLVDGEPWRHPALALEAIVALPTATSGFGSAGVDLGVRGTCSKRFGDFVVYLGGAAIVSGGELGPIKFMPVKGMGFLAGEFEVEPWLAAIYQVWAESATTSNLDGPRGAVYYHGGGFKLTAGRFFVELGMFENGVDVKRSADIIFHVEVGVTL